MVQIAATGRTAWKIRVSNEQLLPKSMVSAFKFLILPGSGAAGRGIPSTVVNFDRTYSHKYTHLNTYSWLRPLFSTLKIEDLDKKP